MNSTKDILFAGALLVACALIGWLVSRLAGAEIGTGVAALLFVIGLGLHTK